MRHMKHMKKVFVCIMVVLLLLTLALPVFATGTETETVAEHRTDFGFYPETLKTTLPIMGMGMLGIFLVIGVIALTVTILRKLPNKNKEE